MGSVKDGKGQTSVGLSNSQPERAAISPERWAFPRNSAAKAPKLGATGAIAASDKLEKRTQPSLAQDTSATELPPDIEKAIANDPGARPVPGPPPLGSSTSTGSGGVDGRSPSFENFGSTYRAVAEMQVIIEEVNRTFSYQSLPNISAAMFFLLMKMMELAHETSIQVQQRREALEHQRNVLAGANIELERAEYEIAEALATIKLVKQTFSTWLDFKDGIRNALAPRNTQLPDLGEVKQLLNGGYKEDANRQLQFKPGLRQDKNLQSCIGGYDNLQIERTVLLPQEVEQIEKHLTSLEQQPNPPPDVQASRNLWESYKGAEQKARARFSVAYMIGLLDNECKQVKRAGGAWLPNPDNPAELLSLADALDKEKQRFLSMAQELNWFSGESSNYTDLKKRAEYAQRDLGRQLKEVDESFKKEIAGIEAEWQSGGLPPAAYQAQKYEAQKSYRRQKESIRESYIPFLKGIHEILAFEHRHQNGVIDSFQDHSRIKKEYMGEGPEVRRADGNREYAPSCLLGKMQRADDHVAAWQRQLARHKDNPSAMQAWLLRNVPKFIEHKDRVLRQEIDNFKKDQATLRQKQQHFLTGSLWRASYQKKIDRLQNKIDAHERFRQDLQAEIFKPAHLGKYAIPGAIAKQEVVSEVTRMLRYDLVSTSITAKEHAYVYNLPFAYNFQALDETDDLLKPEAPAMEVTAQDEPSGLDIEEGSAGTELEITEPDTPTPPPPGPSPQPIIGVGEKDQGLKITPGPASKKREWETIFALQKLPSSKKDGEPHGASGPRPQSAPPSSPLSTPAAGASTRLIMRPGSAGPAPSTSRDGGGSKLVLTPNRPSMAPAAASASSRAPLVLTPGGGGGPPAGDQPLAEEAAEPGLVGDNFNPDFLAPDDKAAYEHGIDEADQFISKADLYNDILLNMVEEWRLSNRGKNAALKSLELHIDNRGALKAGQKAESMADSLVNGLLGMLHKTEKMFQEIQRLKHSKRLGINI